MYTNNYSIYVLLDEKANILEFESTLKDFDTSTEEYIGKNWFDSFINFSDKEKVMEAFNGLFSNDDKWKSFGNDLRIDNKHRLFDFENEVLNIEGKKYIRSLGVEHIYNS